MRNTPARNSTLLRFNAAGEIVQRIVVANEDAHAYFGDDIVMGEGDPDTHYVARRTVIAYTDKELAAKRGMPTGFVWQMPQRIAVDMRTLAQVKAAKLSEIAQHCDAALAPITSGYPDSEQQTWDKQEAEARGYLAGKTIVPMLTALSVARGVPVDDLAQRIVAKADAFAAFCVGVIGRRQKLEDAVNAATTAAAVNAITWTE